MSISCIDNIINKVELKNGKQLIVREAVADDAKNIIEYLNIIGGESDNLLFGAGEFRLTVEQEREYIKNINKQDNSLMLLGIIDNKIISLAQINTINRKRIKHNSEISISVKKEHWGVGIGSVIMKQLIKFAEDNSTIKNITLGVISYNHNAIKLYKKHGFEKTGVNKNFFNINDNYYDEIQMALYIK